MRCKWFLIALTITLLMASCAQSAAPLAEPESAFMPEAEVYTQFEAKLESLRQELRIPGLSAAIVADRELVWSAGFGYADLEEGVEVTPDTPFRLASVTKPIGATLIMMLVEEGLLDLDDPVSDYGVDLQADGVVRVRHLLTHTSEGVPGTSHDYNGSLYALLGNVAEGATGTSFADLLYERILEPLGMQDTAPNYSTCDLERVLADSQDARDIAYARVGRSLAKPYQLDHSYNIVQGVYPVGFSPAAGLISTVIDLARFDIALDQNRLLSKETMEEMFAPAYSTHGDRLDLQYGLGWYVQEYEGNRLLWHTGRNSPSVSALYLKLPDENLTFIVLANTANLTTPFPLGDGDVLYSTLAFTFYKTFLFPRQFGQEVPEINWDADKADLMEQLAQVKSGEVRRALERELWSYRQLYASVGRDGLVGRLWSVHRDAFPDLTIGDLDRHAVRGVDYYPHPGNGIELGEAELNALIGRLELKEWADFVAGELPQSVSLELLDNALVVVGSDNTCLALIPVAPTRFLAPENPNIFLEFQMDGDKLGSMQIMAGDLVAAIYRPSG